MRLIWFLAIALALTITACDVPTDTPVPETPTLRIVPPSATVAPIPPTIITPGDVNVGQENFTPGAPALSNANPLITVTPTPAPTQAAISMQFTTDDGLAIAATYYAAPVRPAPTVLLVHMLGSSKESWQPFAMQLQKAGYNAVAIDLRGHGETGGTMDWNKAPGDVSTVLARLSALPGIDPQRISVIGASIGANLALGACADRGTCKAVALLSPGLDYEGIKTADAMTKYGRRPVLIVASKGDTQSAADSVALDKLAQGDHQLQLYDGNAHGTVLLSTQPTLPGLIIQWLGSRNT